IFGAPPRVSLYWDNIPLQAAEATMENAQIEAAWSYHNGTRHPGGYLLDPHHVYNWELRPRLFKVYEGAPSLPLEDEFAPLGMPALEALGGGQPAEGDARGPDRGELARLLQYSAGITKTLDYGRGMGRVPFRAAACTGALYHIELYAVCGDLPGLEAGVYHFDPRQPALTLLRRGDFRPRLVQATGGAPAVADAPLLLIYSDVYWRNAVKYQARAYRHAYWDSGTIVANTLAVAAARRLPAQVVASFVDDEVNQLLGLDTEREFVLQMVAVGSGSPAPEDSPPLEPLQATVQPLPGQRRLDSILEMHEASSLPDAEAVAAWREARLDLALPEPQGQIFPLQPLSPQEQPDDDLGPVIVRRGSTRRFRREPITFAQLSTILQASVTGVAADFKGPEPLALSQAYVIANAVEGLPAGAYVYHAQRQALELLQEGQFRDQAGQLALGQALGADASANLYFLSPLGAVLERFGNRGYRAAQLEAATTAGRIYLASYALRLGATGLTFFDDAVTDFFSPHAEGKRVMFLMTVGQPA
ncbi:MAG: SagB family peptide dehydrogenase, partial [bacterium]